MSAPPEYQLDHVEDFAALSVEQFERMLPDFIRWFTLAKEMQEMGAEATGFILVDDGEPGVLSELQLIVKGTGNTQTFTFRKE